MERRLPQSGRVSALEARRRFSGREVSMWVAGLGAFALVVLAADIWADAELPRIGAAVSTHSLAVAIVTGVTSYLLYSYASASRNRSFLALGSTYLALACLALLIPVVTHDAVVNGERLLGAASSARAVTVAWRMMLPFGVIASTVLMRHDALRFRRPGRGAHVGAAVVSTLVVVALLAALLTAGLSLMPDLLAANGTPTAFAVGLDRAALALSVIALVMVLVLVAQGGSTIARWLFALMALSVGDALLQLRDSAPFTVAWYSSRFFFLAALTVLMFLLTEHLGRIQRRATRSALTDGLTGLMSRAGLIELLDHEIPRAQHLGNRGALLWVDLDSFKAINDQLGHGAGDEVLATMADRLVHSARKGDAVARLGGDEFGILVCDLPEHLDAHELADRLLLAVDAPLFVDGSDNMITASIGVAEFPADAQRADDLLRLADLAMYAAKRDGGDAVERYSSVLAIQVRERAAMRHRLARAVHDEQFELHYQPVVDLVRGRTIGAETLVRWQTDDGLVAAADFIPFAEVSGQIRAVGHVVLRKLAADLARFGPHLPHGFRVSVNLSAPEVADPSVLSFLCDGPLSPMLAHLAVEVTEGITLNDYARAENHVHRLRDAGALIAIDDFGSGFANIDALQSLRPQVIKVDRVFTQRAERGDAAGLAFLRAALTIGDAFGAVVVAEGIESERHRAVVLETGIRFGQGYLLGAPSPGMATAVVGQSPDPR